MLMANQRDLIKEYITYLQVEKGLARHTLEQLWQRSQAAGTMASKTGLEAANLTRQICENGSRSFHAKGWRLRRSRVQ